MQQEVNNIHQLLLADAASAQIAKQILLGNPELAQQFYQDLDAVWKLVGSVDSLILLIDKVKKKRNKLTLLEKKAVAAYPLLTEQFTYLDLQQQHLVRVLEPLEQFPYLEYLNLGSNKIEELPDALATLHHLKRLNLDRNQMVSIPAIVFRIPFLEELHLAENQLTSLPAAIGQLKQLKVLWAYTNQFTQLPPELFQLPHLRKLGVGNNLLRALPETMGEAKALEWLSIGGFKDTFDKIPENFSALQNLKELTIGSGEVIENLELITHCTQLKKLTLELSQEQPFLEGLGRLQELQELTIRVRDNGKRPFPLRSLGEGILQLPNLQKLHLQDHYIDTLERVKIVKQFPNATFRWF